MRTPVAVVIAGKDLRQRFRDRSALVLGFAAPLAIAALMSLAFRGTEQFHFTAGVVNNDHGQMASAFGQVITSKEVKSVMATRSYDTEASARAALKHRSVSAVFVVPSGFSQSAAGAHPESIRVLTSIDLQLAGQVADSIAQSFVTQVNADHLSVATAVTAGASSGRIAELAASASTLRPPLDIVSRPSGSHSLKVISYYAPGMGIFFLLFAIGFTARGYFVERRNGTLERMSAAARPGQIILGKSLAVLVYGSASLGTMALVTSLLFGADWGGPLLATAVGIPMVLSVVALTALVIVLARSERQAEGMASIVTFGLALMGGNFVFLSTAPPLLRKLALFTPNGWALRAYLDLATGPHRWSTIALPVVAMLSFALAVSAITAILLRRSEVSLS